MGFRQLPVLLAIFITTCSPKNVETLWVNSYLVPCPGVAPDSCMQIRKTSEGPWENWYGEIEGFTYEPGAIYQLEVEKRTNANSPADASSISYTLVSVLWKKPDPVFLLNSQWSLVAIRGNPFETQVGGSVPRLDIQVANRSVNGKAFCNQMNGSLSTLTDATIQFGPIATTRMICPDQKLEDTYLRELYEVQQYSIEDSELVFYDDEKVELLRYSK